VEYDIGRLGRGTTPNCCPITGSGTPSCARAAPTPSASPSHDPPYQRGGRFHIGRFAPSAPATTSIIWVTAPSSRASPGRPERFYYFLDSPRPHRRPHARAAHRRLHLRRRQEDGPANAPERGPYASAVSGPTGRHTASTGPPSTAHRRSKCWIRSGRHADATRLAASPAQLLGAARTIPRGSFCPEARRRPHRLRSAFRTTEIMAELELFHRLSQVLGRMARPMRLPETGAAGVRCLGDEESGAGQRVWQGRQLGGRAGGTASRPSSPGEPARRAIPPAEAPGQPSAGPMAPPRRPDSNARVAGQYLP